MGFLTKLLTFPLSGPICGTLWVAARVGEAAEAEENSPAMIRQRLTDLEQKLESGEIDESLFEREEKNLIKQLKRFKSSKVK